ncbi:hypothetical protein F511_13476 [Dorcoceras hygrometricum]|uniref:Uncharacterized protein n=1 Tax=Dorcoceras hygrometricum TaxID=472368 RepID=A0A2Z7C3B4_9LAMI|nr:hypothetical protein F511_13476 [Dorcoceras hygrometricum]
MRRRPPELETSICDVKCLTLEARKTNFVPGESTSAIDLKVLAMLSSLHIFVLEELKAEMQAHGLIWEITCCSRLFEGPNRDRGAVIARSNTNIRSSYWIRTMILVNGSWVIEPCADYWKPLPRRIIQNEILPQIAYVDTLPPVSILRSDVVSVRPVLGAASIFDTVVQLAPVPSLADAAFDSDVHMDAIPSSDSDSDSSSSLDLMDIHVDTPMLFTTADALQGKDTVVDQSLLVSTAPTATVFTESFAQLRDSISQISIKQVWTQRSLDDLKCELLFKIDNLAKVTAEARDQQTQFIQNSLKSVRQEARTQGDEVKAMDEQLATIRSEMLDFRAQAQENHLNRGGDAKKGECGSSRPQPPPDDQSRPSGGSASRGSGSRGSGDGSSKSRADRGGSSNKRPSSSGGGGPYGPYKKDVEYWLFGKISFKIFQFLL